ncbi:hypothetical protein KDL01_10210 [Actinospica durhamensis]|uniref:Uncharacterized protein n=1 Tax=Actinospica durhamensis TaxID=1508375 RepID=A0A941IR70_9ACTN|nr:hypothetical protein [Actinospica durhamensis]MBR7833638.1 hypothetical protein [Actinospica durhamensis]
MTTTTSIRELYYALRTYTGPAAHRDVLAPWADGHAAAVAELLAPLAVHGGWRRVEYVWGDLLEQAYALCRVSDLLLLGFQSPLPSEIEKPWAHELHLPESGREPRIAEDEYVSFFAALGMRREEVARFDPFFHEIAAVEQSEDPAAPIEVAQESWPCLMLGELLFSRAGVRVRAGEQHAVAGLADRSTLNEVFLRRYRPTYDMSLGWGTNSQWKTDFRRDYLTADAYQFNVDADADIDEETEFGDARLTPSERRDLLRHRCVVRPLADVPEDEEPWGGCRRLTLPRA